MAKKKTETETAVNPDDRIFRLLSSALLISSQTFTQQLPSKQTTIIRMATPTQPVRFVPNFVDLSDVKRLRDNLLAGKNVDLELEFNGIRFTDEERALMKAFLPVLAKINSAGPAYPWLNPGEEFGDISITRKPNGDPNRIHRRGYGILITTAKSIWNKASTFWSGGKKPAAHTAMGSHYSSGHRVTYYADSVGIGCQTIARAEVEYVARLMGWDPVIGRSFGRVS